jgi:comEA protein
MLNFTATEKRALIITISIVIIAALIQYILPHYNNPQIFDYSQSDSIFYRLSYENVNYPREGSAQTYQQQKKKKSKPIPFSINLNTASKSQLEKLPRIGPKTADRIINYRKSVNGFSSNEELMKVKGIGPKTFENIKPYLKEM